MLKSIILNCTITILCFGVVLMFSPDICSAKMGKRFQDNELKHYHTKNTSNIQGEISQIRPDYIGVITATDNATKTDTEMLFILDEEVVFKSKNLNELAEGDKVKITYENITEPDPDNPGEEKFVQRNTLEIHYLSSKSNSLQSGKNK